MSSKKLQNLLNPSPISNKDQSRLLSNTNNKPPLSRKNSLTPLATIPSSGSTGVPPAYHVLPKNQNIFYNPTVKTEQTICPSPMIQFPLKVLSREHIVEATAGLLLGSERAANNEQKLNENYNDVSESLNSIFQQLQVQFPSQPKNLKELLQRSFSSMPSNSIFQTSFNSAMPSPYVSHATPSSHFHMSAVSEVSKGPNSGLLGTPLQHNPLLKGKQAGMQSSDLLQSALISQITELLKHKSEMKIRMAIAELLLKYKSLGIVNDKTLEKEISNLQGIAKVGGTNYPQENLLRNQSPQILNLQSNTLFQQVENREIYKGNTKKIPELLSTIPKKSEHPQGFSLTSQVNVAPLQKMDEFKNNGGNIPEQKKNIPPSKVNAARRELFDLEAVPEKRNSAQLPVQTNLLKEEPISNADDGKKTTSESEDEDNSDEQKSIRKKKPVSEKIKKNNAGIGRKVRIKRKGPTAEEYMEYRESQVKHNDKRLNQTVPVFEDNGDESTMYYENNRSMMIDRDLLTRQEFI